MPLRLERSHQNQRIELIVTANVGPVWSGQHLEHNAQRQNAPTHSTPYFAIIATSPSKEKTNSNGGYAIRYMNWKLPLALPSTSDSAFT